MLLYKHQKDLRLELGRLQCHRDREQTGKRVIAVSVLQVTYGPYPIQLGAWVRYIRRPRGQLRVTAVDILEYFRHTKLSTVYATDAGTRGVIIGASSVGLDDPEP